MQDFFEDGEKELENLSECNNLKTLIMAGNPWVDEKGDDFKKEVLIALDKLTSLKQINDMEEVTEEEEKRQTHGMHSDVQDKESEEN